MVRWRNGARLPAPGMVQPEPHPNQGPRPHSGASLCQSAVDVLGVEAGPRRLADRHVRGAPHPAAEEGRAAGLRLRRHLLDGLRHAGDPDRPDPGRRASPPPTTSCRSPSSCACCWSSSSPATARRSWPTPAAAGPTSSAGRTSASQVALVAGASILVDYVLTVAVSVSGGRRRHHLGVPGGGPLPRAAVPGLRRADDRRQPARPEGVGDDLRAPDLHLRRDPLRHDRRRPLPLLQRRHLGRSRPTRPPSTSSPAAPPSPGSA